MKKNMVASDTGTRLRGGCRRAAKLGIALAIASVASVLPAWDVEHDEVAQLTGEFLPKEVKAAFDFDDFAILMANCHFPDMTEWPCEDGKRRFHTLQELASHVGASNAQTFAELTSLPTRA